MANQVRVLIGILLATCITSSAAVLYAQGPPANGSPPKEIDKRLLNRFRRSLLKGSARGRVKALDSIRRNHIYDPKVIDLVAEHLNTTFPNELKKDSVATTTLLVIETLGVGATTEKSRESILKWTRESLNKVDEGRTAVGEDRDDGTIGDWDVVLQTLMLALRNYSHADVQKLVEELIRHRDYRVQILAIDVLARQRDYPKGIKLLDECAVSPNFAKHYGYRHAVLDAALQIGNEDAMQLLQTISPRLNGLLGRLVQFRLAHQPRRDANQERNLAIVNRPIQADGGNATASSGFTTQLQSDKRMDQSSYRYPRFFGLPLYADRITFVIDLSGSMSRPLPSGRRRLEQAQIELANAISQLRPNQSFRVIGYQDQVVSLSPTLIEATPLNKKRFLHQLGLLESSGKTNLYGAVIAAIRDVNQPEMIVLLSDGKPTTGEITEPGELLRSVNYQNLFRRIMISTVSLGPSTDLMVELASSTGGQHRRTD